MYKQIVYWGYIVLIMTMYMFFDMKDVVYWGFIGMAILVQVNGRK